MASALQHALLGIACVALLGAGHRLAARLSDRPSDRFLAAAVVAAAAAVLEALVLGLVGLGSDGVALTLAAVATYLGVAAAVRAPERPTARLLGDHLQALSARGQALACAVVGATAVFVAWPLTHPLIGFDGALYHLPEIAAWVENGRPGSIVLVSYLFPFANYPVANEVALTWAAAISASLAPVVLWTQVLVALTALAGFVGLRALGIGRSLAALAVATVLTTPVLVSQPGTPKTDAPALCWLVVAGALAARSSGRPALLAPALVATGLAVGTKATALPLALLVAALAAWRSSGSLHQHRRSLVLAAAAAMGVGGVWYVRNAATHGSPLWPFSSFPGGDPVPDVWRQIQPSLLERPEQTLTGRRVSGYLDALAGALVLGAGAGWALLGRHRRAAKLAALVFAAALLIWAASPSTGQPDTAVFANNPVSATRYALPALAVAGLSVALAASSGPGAAKVGVAVLVAALAWNLVTIVRADPISVPDGFALAVGGAAGAAVGFAHHRVRPLVRGFVPPGPLPKLALGVSCAVLLGLAASIPSRQLVERHAEAAPVPGAPVARWAAAQPGFGTRQPIYFAGAVFGQLAGNRFEHRLVLLPPATPCDEVRRKAATGLLVVSPQTAFARLGVDTPAGCVASLRPAYVSSGVRVYGNLEGPGTASDHLGVAGSSDGR